MDTHFFKIYEMHKPEFDIYEGLILSHPLYDVERLLKNREFSVKPNYKQNTFNITFTFDRNVSTANNKMYEILRLTNNLGWFPSYLSSVSNIGFKYSKENFEDFINKNLCILNICFEAKYDINEKKIPTFLYHVCPLLNVEKILKIGLVPKSRSKKSFHPERVYLTKTLKDAYKVASFFNNDSTNRKWAILEINTSVIDDYLKLFKDPNYLDLGVYTLNNIMPSCLSLKDTLDFGT